MDKARHKDVLLQELKEQIKYFELHAIKRRKTALIVQIVQILSIISISIIAVLETSFVEAYGKTIISILAMIAMILTSYLYAYKPDSQWSQYRLVVEELKRELFHFETSTGIYSEEGDKQVKEFHERVNRIISSESSKWFQTIKS